MTTTKNLYVVSRLLSYILHIDHRFIFMTSTHAHRAEYGLFFIFFLTVVAAALRVRSHLYKFIYIYVYVYLFRFVIVEIKFIGSLPRERAAQQ
jgi:hypothetical protein